ncbi:MAG: FGGY family carbohydrate kinase, partial [Microbacterium sp.]
MGRRAALGIDVGTSSVKASLLRETGEVVAAGSAPYPTEHPQEGWSEQDPSRWWAAVGEAVGRVMQGRDRDDVVVGLTGQMHTSVIADAAGEVLRPAPLWSDRRSAGAVARLAAAHPEIAAITGNALIPAFSLAHLAWIAEHEPETFARIASVTVPKDHLRRRLGAGETTEPSDASAMALLDYRTDRWAAEIADLIGLPVSALPDVVPSHEVTGEIGAVPPGAESMRGARVVGGAGDQAAQAVALGVTAPGALGLSLGTSGVAFQSLAEPRPQSFRHAYPRTWLALNSMHAAGLALSWWAGLTGIPVADLSAGAEHRTDVPTFLPYLQGHRGTQGAPGSLIDLDSRHDAYDIARAIMEGVAAELVALADSVGGGTGDEVVYLGGGGGRSAVWRQIVADAFGRPVAFSDRDSSFGAALIAAETDGWA